MRAGWGMVQRAGVLRAPQAELAPRDPEAAGAPAGFRLRDTLPRLSDYISCFALMALPAVAATMAIMFLRTATSGVQFSLYIVYLDGIGLTGACLPRSRPRAVSARCLLGGRCVSAIPRRRC